MSHSRDARLEELFALADQEREIELEALAAADELERLREENSSPRSWAPEKRAGEGLRPDWLSDEEDAAILEYHKNAPPPQFDENGNLIL